MKICSCYDCFGNGVPCSFLAVPPGEEPRELPPIGGNGTPICRGFGIEIEVVEPDAEKATAPTSGFCGKRV